MQKLKVLCCKEEELPYESLSVQKDLFLQKIPKVLLLGSEKSGKKSFFSVLTGQKIGIINEQISMRLSTCANSKQKIKSNVSIFSESFINEYPDILKNNIRSQDGIIIFFSDEDADSQQKALEYLKKIGDNQQINKSMYIMVLETFSKKLTINLKRQQSVQLQNELQEYIDTNQQVTHLKLDINDQKTIKRYYQTTVNGALTAIKQQSFTRGFYQSTVSHYTEQSVISPDSILV